MFEKVTPESVGISSEHIKKYLNVLKRAELSIHDIVMIRNGKVFFEGYWKPFHKDFTHRLYSASKSFVSIAIGFLYQDGLIDLNAPAISYINEDYVNDAPEYIKKQTIRDMLMMSTGKLLLSDAISFFKTKPDDRLRDYFTKKDEKLQGQKLPGAIFEYDSPGSFVLGSIVEIISGKTLIEFLKERLFDKIGVSDTIHCLTCPGGHAWGDSAVIANPLDFAKVCQFMLQKGEWNGEQILDRGYAEEATSNLISSDRAGHLVPHAYGYGYQFWRTMDNSFYFCGMGSQFGICTPDKNTVCVINADTQGFSDADVIIIGRLFEEIIEKASDAPLPENKEAYDSLCTISDNLTLYSLHDSVKNNAAIYSGKEFIMKENPMGITKLKFTFEGDEGKMEYTNAQGDKTIYFGIDKNVFAKFPQEGYSKEMATKFAPGHYYDCAASATWTHENCLTMLVQIIDEYFGRLHMRISFMGDDKIAVMMDKIAEDFLGEYEGYMEGYLA